jgi:hypothetical protein
MNETKNDKFKRLATIRTNAILNKLRQLGNLSNKSNYQYTEPEVNKIFSIIEKQFRNVKYQFKKPKEVKIDL